MHPDQSSLLTDTGAERPGGHVTRQSQKPPGANRLTLQPGKQPLFPIAGPETAACAWSLLFLPLLHTGFFARAIWRVIGSPRSPSPLGNPAIPADGTLIPWQLVLPQEITVLKVWCLIGFALTEVFPVCQSPRPAPSHFLCSAQTHIRPFCSLQTPVLRLSQQAFFLITT